MTSLAFRVALVFLFLVTLGAPGRAGSGHIVLQSTTSTQNSGLLDHILPRFTAASGVEVRTVAVGTGQAIRNSANGDGDVLLVHARQAEEAFVADGYGLARHDVMYNDFVIVGPADDPAGLAGAQDVFAALKMVTSGAALFASRGDDSGTHKAEQRLWAEAGVSPAAASGSWYREAGAGMGATLNLAVGMGAYALTDRATWIAFSNKGDHRIVVEGDEKLFNQYGVIAVNPARHPHVNAGGAAAFVTWITGPDGQAAIASYTLGGEQLFFPNAASPAQ